MNSKKLLVTLLTATTLCASSALASEIYRYTDDEGNIVYGDRPTGDPTEERMHVASARTDSAAVQQRYNDRYQQPEPDPVTQQGAAQQLEEEEQLSRAERKAAAAQRAEQCLEYRAKMETLVTARRLFREDEAGERVYLNEEEQQEARDKVQELIEQYCD